MSNLLIVLFQMFGFWSLMLYVYFATILYKRAILVSLTCKCQNGPNWLLPYIDYIIGVEINHLGSLKEGNKIYQKKEDTYFVYSAKYIF